MSTTPRTPEDLATTKRVQGSLPAGFDPAAHPIIARHVFGVEPFPIDRIAAEVVANLQFRRRVQQVHRLGDRVFGELLAELGAERGIQTVIDQKLAIFAELDTEVIKAVEAAVFWPAPLHELRGT